MAHGDATAFQPMQAQAMRVGQRRVELSLVNVSWSRQTLNGDQGRSFRCSGRSGAGTDSRLEPMTLRYVKHASSSESRLEA
jgi:hypothetical protein